MNTTSARLAPASHRTARILMLTILGALAWSTLTAGTCTPRLKIGEPCQTTGDGFTLKNPCIDLCVGWEVTCPSGQKVTPNVCSGALCSAGGSCPSGQVCVQIDSFAANSRCMPAAVCGGIGTTSWEDQGPDHEGDDDEGESQESSGNTDGVTDSAPGPLTR